MYVLNAANFEWKTPTETFEIRRSIAIDIGLCKQMISNSETTYSDWCIDICFREHDWLFADMLQFFSSFQFALYRTRMEDGIVSIKLIQLRWTTWCTATANEDDKCLFNINEIMRNSWTVRSMNIGWFLNMHPPCTFYRVSSAQCGFHSLLPLAFSFLSVDHKFMAAEQVYF